MGIWDILAKPLTEGVSTWVAKREERKTMKEQMKGQLLVKEFEMKMAQFDRQIDLKKQGLEMDANWEMEFARQAASSWKDEFTLIVISIPAILCFIPGGATYVSAGFLALSNTPFWYQGAFLTLFFATVGVRYWRRTQSDT